MSRDGRQLLWHGLLEARSADHACWFLAAVAHQTGLMKQSVDLLKVRLEVGLRVRWPGRL